MLFCEHITDGIVRLRGIRRNELIQHTCPVGVFQLFLILPQRLHGDLRCDLAVCCTAHTIEYGKTHAVCIVNGIRCGKIVPENIVHVQPFQIEIIFVVAANFSDVC